MFHSLEDLEKFRLTRANELRLTAPRSIKLEDPTEELNKLFIELVDASLKTKRERATKIPELEALIKKYPKTLRLRYREAVTVPVVNRPVIIPYIYQNGMQNLIRPEKFSADTSGRIKAESLACEGDLLQKYPTNEGFKRKLILIPKIEMSTSDSNEFLASIKGVFDLYGIKTLSPEGIIELASEIEKDIERSIVI